MPTYEYRCQDKECNHYFEAFRTISGRKEPEDQPCPLCNRLQVKQVIETPPTRGDGVRLGLIRPSDGFREVLHKIHEKVPGSTIKDTARYF